MSDTSAPWMKNQNANVSDMTVTSKKMVIMSLTIFLLAKRIV